MKLSSKLACIGTAFTGVGIGTMIAIFLLPLTASFQTTTRLRDAAILLAMIGTFVISIAVTQVGERNAERDEDSKR